MAPRLRIDRDEPLPGVTELRVHGEVDLGGGKVLERALEAAVADGGGVLVNLSGCSFLDSSGLGALIRIARAAPEPGRVVVYCLPDGIVRHVFSLTRAHTLLPVHADRDAALAAAGG